LSRDGGLAYFMLIYISLDLCVEKLIVAKK